MTPATGAHAVSESWVRTTRLWLTRQARSLGLQAGSVRCPRPGVLSAHTEDGDLVTVEIRVYPKGQW